MDTIMRRALEAQAHIRAATQEQPALGMILGSGLGGFAERLDEAIRIPFREIPGFPQPSVEGHAGELVLGRYCGRPVAALKIGRAHV